MQTQNPFIHLLESPNAKYFFDVNKNEIVPVDNDLHDVLGKILDGQPVELTESEEQKMARLKSMGYLSDNRVKVIRHPESAMAGLYLERKIDMLLLQLTQDCNLRCRYCSYTDATNTKQRKHSSKRMTFALAKKGIDFLLDHSIDKESINVGFYGGEPLLEFELLKQVVAYAEEIAFDKKLSFSITTNGTLITEEIMEFFIRHDVRLAISLDGPQEVHDSNRRFADDDTGSFMKVIKTLEWISEKYPDYTKNMLLSMVIDPKFSFDYLDSLFEDYPYLRKMLIMPSIIEDGDSMVKNIYSDEFIMERRYQFFLAFLNHFNRLDDTMVSTLIKQDFEREKYLYDNFECAECLPDQTAPGGPCVPGKLRLFMDVDGNFLPCERVNEISEIMRIGKIDEGFYLDKVDAVLNVGAVTAEECKACWAFTNCGICAKQADGSHEFSSEMRLSCCDRIKNDFDYFLHCMIMIREFQDVYHHSYSEVSS